jgi:hypothetical protein
MSPATAGMEKTQTRAIAGKKRFMLISFEVDDARFLTSERIEQLREFLASGWRGD